MPGRILVVDDEPSMCEMIESFLRLRGLETRWYTRAEEAFEALKEDHFSVILTDLHMPGMDGIDLAFQHGSAARQGARGRLAATPNDVTLAGVPEGAVDSLDSLVLLDSGAPFALR